MTVREHRLRQLALDRCLQLLEEAQVGGRTRVDGERAGVIADHRLEGRRIDRVLDDIFALQAQLLGQAPEDRRQRNGS